MQYAETTGEAAQKHIFVQIIHCKNMAWEKDRILLMHTVKNHGTFNKYTMFMWDSEQMHIHMKRKLQTEIDFCIDRYSV